ncbi:MAG: DNA-directed DNA polymerase I [Candidatus Heimdallarchaeota archaeon]|nr:DNA-directed DNA polymerase I [Candidatus Heimdallarchaeota archaeon]
MPEKKQSSLETFFGSQSSEIKGDRPDKKEQPTTKSQEEVKEVESKMISKEEEIEEEELEEEEEEEDILEDKAPIELCPDNSPPCCLLHSLYDGSTGRAFLMLLNEHDNRLYGWYDQTNHQPYCLSDLSVEELQRISPVKNYKNIVDYQIVKKQNLLIDKEISMTKILVTDPLAVGGRSDSLRNRLPEAWEARIRYHKNYLYDRNLVPGMYYQIQEGKFIPVKQELAVSVKKEIESIFKDESEEVKKLIPQYLPRFLARMPHIRRAAMDIEVFTENMNRIADPKKAKEEVISVAIVGNDGLKKILVLKRENVPLGKRAGELPRDAEIVFFDNEANLLRETFRIMNDYPLIITFNGDNFDLPYLSQRAYNLRIKKEENPIIVRSRYCKLKHSLHFDAYRFFNQAAIRVYAFGGKYNEVSLDAISSALLDVGKVELENDIGDLSLHRLVWYNYWDSKITLELTTFNNDITIRLIILLMRLTRMPFEDINRQAVSSWIRNWLFAEHRQRGYLIPNSEEIIQSRGESSTKAIIKGKKYKGGLVVEPQPGIHFDVTVLDFASLYPSIIKTWNLSYETMNCSHESCKNQVMVPETDHWVCTKRKGLMSILIGFIRDMRVFWFKPKAKDQSVDQNTREAYDVIQAALKVVINASYGVFGAPHFPFYCPPLAEATAAIGRQAIRKTIERCKQMGIEVIYGDTDSVFLKHPTEQQIEKLIDWSQKELKIDLDVEKNYRYLALSERKKNYLGVYPSGKVDVKGLLGKKRNTPPFIKEVFNEIVKILSSVKKEEDFEVAREQIKGLVKDSYSKLKNKEYPLEALAFQVQLNKQLDQYVKTTPQHVKAARQLLVEKGDKKVAGDFIYFVKTVDSDGVRAIELADVSRIDTDKYIAQMESTLAQVLEPIGVSFDRIMGVRSLDDFFA